LSRVDGTHNGVFQLSRRTRIGRAPGCELHVESSSVSRHHALVMMTTREVIIEDLRSTNGVYINGRKITRQLLNDGDRLAIGEAQFVVRIKPIVRSAATAQSASASTGAAAGAGAEPDAAGSSAGASEVVAAPSVAAPAGEPPSVTPRSGPDVPGGESR
jgi:predicted component of type VI protein secretion system